MSVTVAECDSCLRNQVLTIPMVSAVDGTQRDTQIDQNTPNGDQSLFTTTRGASSLEPSSSSWEGAYASAETTAFETLQLKK